jgi:hypothetical protein
VFICICALLIADVSFVRQQCVLFADKGWLQMDDKVFIEVLLQQFLKLANDTVPNIRMMLGRTLNEAPGI